MFDLVGQLIDYRLQCDNIVRCGVLVFFTADDGRRGRELWVTDGTSDGTTVVAELIQGVRSSEFGQLFDYNGILVFTLKIGDEHWQMWRSDGSATGTTMIADFPFSKSAPDQLIVYNDDLYFTASDLSAGTELWASDGTPTGTRRITDINQGTGSAKLSSPLVVDDTLYFSASNIENGCQLWQSDGTENGTALIDGQPNQDVALSANSRCFNLAELDGRIYFDFDGSIWRYSPPNAGNSPISSTAAERNALSCDVIAEPPQERDVDAVIERRLACLTVRHARRESGRDLRYPQSCINWAASRIGDNQTHNKLLVEWFSNAIRSNSLDLDQHYTKVQRLVLSKRAACISTRQKRRDRGDNRSYQHTCWQWAADRVTGLDRLDTKRLLQQVKNTQPDFL